RTPAALPDRARLCSSWPVGRRFLLSCGQTFVTIRSTQSTDMDMEITFIENIARIRLRGRLDTPGVDQVEAKLTASVVPGGKNTVVDLSQVSFVASMGLRMFIGIAKALKRHNARMVLFAPQSQVNEVFETVLMREILPIVADEAEALRF